MIDEIPFVVGKDSPQSHGEHRGFPFLANRETTIDQNRVRPSAMYCPAGASSLFVCRYLPTNKESSFSVSSVSLWLIQQLSPTE